MSHTAWVGCNSINDLKKKGEGDRSTLHVAQFLISHCQSVREGNKDAIHTDKNKHEREKIGVRLQLVLLFPKG